MRRHTGTVRVAQTGQLRSTCSPAGMERERNPGQEQQPGGFRMFQSSSGSGSLSASGSIRLLLGSGHGSQPSAGDPIPTPIGPRASARDNPLCPMSTADRGPGESIRQGSDLRRHVANHPSDGLHRQARYARVQSGAQTGPWSVQGAGGSGARGHQPGDRPRSAQIRRATMSVCQTRTAAPPRNQLLGVAVGTSCGVQLKGLRRLGRARRSQPSAPMAREADESAGRARASRLNQGGNPMESNASRLVHAWRTGGVTTEPRVRYQGHDSPCQSQIAAFCYACPAFRPSRAAQRGRPAQSTPPENVRGVTESTIRMRIPPLPSLGVPIPCSNPVGVHHEA